jgi:hypothetical protein
LAHGEKKSIGTDRIVLVSGPACEIEEVREMFRKYTVDGLSLNAIARDLNQRGVPSIQNKRWTHSVVASLISHPKYVGCNVFNRTTMRLGTAPVAVPPSDWVMCPAAHDAIVDTETFALAQKVRTGRTVRKTNEQLLDELRSLLAVKGKLSNKMIDERLGMPSARTFWYRFGGLRRACELIGYDWRSNGRKTNEQMPQRSAFLVGIKRSPQYDNH